MQPHGMFGTTYHTNILEYAQTEYTVKSVRKDHPRRQEKCFFKTGGICDVNTYSVMFVYVVLL